MIENSITVTASVIEPDDIVTGVKQVMQNTPGNVKGEDRLPLLLYRVNNIGNSNLENLWDFVQSLTEELVRASVFPEDFDFAA